MAELPAKDVFPLPKLRPGVDVHSLKKPVCELEVGRNTGYVLAISSRSLIAVLNDKQSIVSIYRNSSGEEPILELVKKFVIDKEVFSTTNQMVFDPHSSIIVPDVNSTEVLRYNINGKKLDSLPPRPEGKQIGLACGPGKKLYLSVCEEMQRIYCFDPETDQWTTIYLGRDDEAYDGEDEDEDKKNVYSTKRFTPGQLAFGPDGLLYVGTGNCIIVMNPDDGSVIRQIGVQQVEDDEMSNVDGLFVSGDGLVFASDQDARVLVFKAHDGSFVCNLFSQSDIKLDVPWNINMDWEGYLYISDPGLKKIFVF